MSRKQPIVVYKYVDNEIVLTRRFPQLSGRNGAMVFLRSQGCKFPDSIFTGLGNDSIEFPISENTYYEAECDAAPSTATRRKAHGSVEV